MLPLVSNSYIYYFHGTIPNIYIHINVGIASQCEHICMHSWYNHKDIFADVQGRAMKQITELSVELNDRNYFMTLEQKVWLQKCAIYAVSSLPDPEQF